MNSNGMVLGAEELTGPKFVQQYLMRCLLEISPLTSNDAQDAAQCAQVCCIPFTFAADILTLCSAILCYVLKSLMP